MIIEGMNIISLSYEDMKKLNEVAQMYNLDFDDAYQYLAAEKNWGHSSTSSTKQI